jgi:RNA polymerase-binding transcription factor DksA
VLTPEQVQSFRERLKADYAAVESRIAGRSHDIPTSVREEEGVGDRGDESFLIYDRETELDEDDLDRQTLARIRRALRRIEEGTYGVSEVSGKPIPVDRLEAIPYATTLADEPSPYTGPDSG